MRELLLTFLQYKWTCYFEMLDVIEKDKDNYNIKQILYMRYKGFKLFCDLTKQRIRKEEGEK